MLMSLKNYNKTISCLTTFDEGSNSISWLMTCIEYNKRKESEIIQQTTSIEEG